MISDFDQVNAVTHLLSEYSSLILGRLGMNLREEHLRVISIIVEATTDDIGSLTGKLGRLRGVKVKSILSNKLEDKNDINPKQREKFHKR